MDPLLSIWLRDHRRVFQPGDELECEYQVDAVDPDEFQAIEASVLWYTTGKGDEDLAVHYFERRVPGDFAGGDIRSLRSFKTLLPRSPLSYNGRIVKLHWCVRLRLFLKKGRVFTDEHPFTLGGIPAYRDRSG